MKKLLILLMLLTCTSCSALPAEERAFAVALCVEREGTLWRVHGRIPTYKTGGGYTTVTGEGDSLSAALADMDASAPMHLHLSQLRLLVLEEGLGADMSAVLHELSDRVDVRPHCAVAVTDVPAKELMDALKPATGARLSKTIDVLLDTRIEQGAVLPATLADVIRMGERQSPVLIALTLTDGAIDLSGGYGMADSALPLTARETTLLSLLRGDAKTLRLSLSGGTAEVRDARAKIRLSQGMQSASIELTMTVTASAFTADGLEEVLAGELLTLLERLSAAGCDVLGLGRKAILRTANMAEWHGLEWTARLRQISWTVSVGVSGPA